MESMRVLFIFLSLVKMAMAGCRWSNPTWLQTSDSAPRVDISKDKLVTVSWSKRQFQDMFDCVDKFDVGIESQELERRLCSVDRKTQIDSYSCKLDLSNPKHCGKVFTFWVSAVNLNHNRGVQTINTYGNTLLHIKCGEGEQSQTRKVISTSCLSLSPTWLSGPSIRQTGEQQMSVEWNRRQITNAHCVDNFLLKLWESSSFSPKHTTLLFPMTELQDKFGGLVGVSPCKSYTYTISAVAKTRKALDIQGEFLVPCLGETLKKNLGVELDENNAIGISDNRASAARALGQAVTVQVQTNLSNQQRNLAKVKVGPDSKERVHPLLIALKTGDKSHAGMHNNITEITLIFPLMLLLFNLKFSIVKLS